MIFKLFTIIYKLYKLIIYYCCSSQKAFDREREKEKKKAEEKNNKLFSVMLYIYSCFNVALKKSRGSFKDFKNLNYYTLGGDDINNNE